MKDDGDRKIDWTDRAAEITQGGRGVGKARLSLKDTRTARMGCISPACYYVLHARYNMNHPRGEGTGLLIRLGKYSDACTVINSCGLKEQGDFRQAKGLGLHFSGFTLLGGSFPNLFNNVSYRRAADAKIFRLGGKRYLSDHAIDVVAMEGSLLWFSRVRRVGKVCMQPRKRVRYGLNGSPSRVFRLHIGLWVQVYGKLSSVPLRHPISSFVQVDLTFF